MRSDIKPERIKTRHFGVKEVVISTKELVWKTYGERLFDPREMAARVARLQAEGKMPTREQWQFALDTAVDAEITRLANDFIEFLESNK